MDVFIDKKEEDSEALQLCHSRGWIQSDIVTLPGPVAKMRYTFPSPLHATSISWRLLPSSDPFHFQSVKDLATAAIRHFKPSQLTGMRRRMDGPSDDNNPHEARYQVELYRALLDLCGSRVKISPEFASASGASRAGRIDFFISGVNWGIECMRDGDRLAGHGQRFEPDGAYEKWTALNQMNDHILLDFRLRKPASPHPC